ncbi:DEAD/DEAH box helicase family protein [Halomonas sp. ISL-60]|uniref:DEAD/DEAH box helicase family protein n=1 Tax=Halomonas sp. ISL-56 TaxID=2819149 RepID=UPI001BE6B91C|nr:DEAD/DEAH box helicase family protein [Halomonas sp. ISL-56]MBT2771332.1 DEAD/DEAH box helicase family protein [Halomonas sp. ISL-60]MBT2800689.1 DEAD/DEAH box helicase family protein [Halomonas sp. ISL-56]
MNSSNNTINLYNTVAGSGKSSKARTDIAESKNKTLVIVPSRNLCNEWKEKLIEIDSDISIKLIYRDDKKEGMSSSSTKRFLKEMVDSESRVVITTHATFNLAVRDGFKLLDQYDLYIDEAMNTHEIHDFRFYKDGFNYIKNYVDFKADANTNLYRVVANRELDNRMKGIASGDESKVDSIMNDKEGKFKSLFTFLLSAGHDTYVSKETVEKFESINDGTETTTTEFGLVSVVKPDIFKQFSSVTILSAFFHFTESYHVLKFLGYDFVELEKSLTHDRENIHIHYYINRNFTAKIRDEMKNSRGNGIIDYMLEHAMSVIQNEKYIACMNDSSIDKLKGNYEVVNAPHGLNDYDTIQHAIKFQSANANSSVASAFLSIFGITRDIIDRDRNVLLAYQFVMRTCIRNRAAAYANKVVNLFVTDKRHAEFLQQAFTNATISKHDVPQILSIMKAYNINDNVKSTIPKSAYDFKSKFEAKIKNNLKITDKSLKKYHEIMDEFYPTYIKLI